jgi:hypothetical protein
MPYKSQAQAAYFNDPVHKAMLEAKGVDVEEWNRASKGSHLPKRSADKNQGESHMREALSAAK